MPFKSKNTILAVFGAQTAQAAEGGSEKRLQQFPLLSVHSHLYPEEAIAGVQAGDGGDFK